MATSGKKGPSVSDEVKAYIVMRLACFDSTPKVVADVKELFGVDVPSTVVSQSNPDLPASSKQLGQKWRVLFADTRKAFYENVHAIPIANKAYRVQKLQNMAQTAEVKQPRLAASLLEQAAKEMGDFFINKQPAVLGDVETGGLTLTIKRAGEEIKAD